jgi:hypothetical protein
MSGTRVAGLGMAEGTGSRLEDLTAAPWSRDEHWELLAEDCGTGLTGIGGPVDRSVVGSGWSSAPLFPSSASPTSLLPGSHLLLSGHRTQFSAEVEELVVQEESAPGFWMQGTDCKWVIPETEQGRKKKTRVEAVCVLLP